MTHIFLLLVPLLVLCQNLRTTEECSSQEPCFRLLSGLNALICVKLLAQRLPPSKCSINVSSYCHGISDPGEQCRLWMGIIFCASLPCGLSPSVPGAWLSCLRGLLSFQETACGRSPIYHSIVGFSLLLLLGAF